MNVNDVAGDTIPTDFSKHDRLDLIFMRQHTLMEKYTQLEVANGLCLTTDCPVDINDRFGQGRLKNFFWRTTEELGEAVEAFRVHPELKNHMLEELADALHFLVEVHLLAGLTPDNVHNSMGRYCRLGRLVEWAEKAELEKSCFEIIYYLTLASNCLKNRPWKQTHQLTDMPKFRVYLMTTIPMLVSIFVNQGLNADQIFRMYWKKSEVNKFRQRSNY